LGRIVGLDRDHGRILVIGVDPGIDGVSLPRLRLLDYRGQGDYLSTSPVDVALGQQTQLAAEFREEGKSLASLNP
jgi:hypothetical protein